jgi:hypothetical protein
MLASVHHGEADAAGPGDNNASVLSVVSTKASYRCVTGIDDGAKRMLPSLQFLKNAFTANAGKAHASMHMRKTFACETGIGDSREAGACYRCDRAVDAEPRRSRTSRAGAEVAPGIIFYSRTATRSPAVNADKQTSGKRLTHACQTALRNDHAALPHDPLNSILNLR